MSMVVHIEDRSRIGMEVLSVQEVIDEYASDELFLGFRVTPGRKRVWK